MKKVYQRLFALMVLVFCVYVGAWFADKYYKDSYTDRVVFQDGVRESLHQALLGAVDIQQGIEYIHKFIPEMGHVLDGWSEQVSYISDLRGQAEEIQFRSYFRDLIDKMKKILG